MAKKFKPRAITSFDIFWEAYPRKESKKKAAQSWQTLKLDARDLIKILTWLESAVRSDQWSTEKFIPMGATFLNQERWLSDPPTISVPVGGLAPSEPENPPSQSELESIALATVKEADKRLTHWNRRFADHVHGKTCQNGAVCAFVDSKRPKVPTVSEARAAYRRMTVNP